MNDIMKRLHDAANKSRDEAWRPLDVTDESMALNAALAELDAAGYAIVPKEPTEVMMGAVRSLDWASERDLDWDDGYKLMLAAAPKVTK
jgi:hypothetical protein